MATDKQPDKKGRIMHRCVDILVLDTKDRILLLQRTDDDDLFPGKWCLPGGHINKDEPMYDAAKRELEEETGILAKGLIKVGTYDYENDFVTTLFLCDEKRGSFKSKNIQLSVKEHQAAKWVPASRFFQQNLAGKLPQLMRELFFDEYEEEENQD